MYLYFFCDSKSFFFFGLRNELNVLRNLSRREKLVRALYLLCSRGLELGTDKHDVFDVEFSDPAA